MSEKKVSNSLLSNILHTSKRPEHVQEIYQKEEIERFFSFLDQVENPNRKAPILLYILSRGKSLFLSTQTLSRLKKLPKLNPENELFREFMNNFA